jgi:hypothetical protein
MPNLFRQGEINFSGCAKSLLIRLAEINLAPCAEAEVFRYTEIKRMFLLGDFWVLRQRRATSPHPEGVAGQ